jgi:hypothetical protein
MRTTGSPFMVKGRLRAFLKQHPLKNGGIIQPEQKPAKNTDSAPNRSLPFKRTNWGW